MNAATNLEQLQAQAKALQAAIKQAKTNQPTVSKLDTVLAKQQADGGGKWLFVGLWKRLNARLAAGQPFDVAMHELLEQYRLLLSAPDAADRAKALETERVGTPAQTAHARQLVRPARRPSSQRASRASGSGARCPLPPSPWLW